MKKIDRNKSQLNISEAGFDLLQLKLSEGQIDLNTIINNVGHLLTEEQLKKLEYIEGEKRVDLIEGE